MWNNNNASTDSREVSSVSIISIEVYIDDRLAVVKNSRITKFKFLFSWYFVPDTPQCLAMFWFLIEVV